ncbi:uncharacterized protein LOC128227942 isoform X2 [Mya arenaria]|uniref:uncharacterized protein LOC128227942 isoform X2 n=1 Tax=Mya arenaria TaxID=6604 RepID=UPI0022E77AB5|nr:uncharacterized protein LOC128227942 isoform X2 [Mya arenaria]
MSDTEMSEGTCEDWAFVTSAGGIPDDETDSSSSSVEIVGDREEDSGEETLQQVNTARTGPVYVLSLPSRNAAVETDEETVSIPPQRLTDSSPSTTTVTDLSPTSSSLPQASYERQVSAEELEELCRTLDCIKDKLRPLDTAGQCRHNSVTSDQSLDVSISSQYSLLQTPGQAAGEGVEDLEMADTEFLGEKQALPPQEAILEQEAADIRGRAVGVGERDGRDGGVKHETLPWCTVPEVLFFLLLAVFSVLAASFCILYMNNTSSGIHVKPVQQDSGAQADCSTWRQQATLVLLDLLNMEEPFVYQGDLVQTLADVKKTFGDMEAFNKQAVDTLKARQYEAINEKDYLEAELSHKQELEEEIQRLRLATEKKSSVIKEQASEILTLKDELKKADGFERTGQTWEGCFSELSDALRTEMSKMNVAWSEVGAGLHEYADKHLPHTVLEFLKSSGVFTGPTQDVPHQGDNTYKEPQRDYNTQGRKPYKKDEPESNVHEEHTQTKETFSNTGHKVADEGSESSGEQHADNLWTETVFKMMNKTRGQIEHAWEKVRNISGQFWEDNEPSVMRIQQTFTDRLQQLTDRFHQKMTNKVNKWFHKGKSHPRGNKKGGKSCKEKKTFDENDNLKANTKRRKFGSKVDNNEMTTAEKAEDVSKTISSLNAKQYRRLMESDPWQLISLADFFFNYTEGMMVPLLSEAGQGWFAKQRQWWRHQAGIEISPLPQGDDDHRFLCCWQVHVANGNRNYCRRKKKMLAIKENSCILSEINLEPANKKSIKDSEQKKTNTEERFKGTKDKNAQEQGSSDDFLQQNIDGNSDAPPSRKYTKHANEKIQNTDKIKFSDNQHSQSSMNDNGDDDNWYLSLGEGREYLHQVPDTWYFRRSQDRENKNFYQGAHSPEWVESGEDNFDGDFMNVDETVTRRKRRPFCVDL